MSPKRSNLADSPGVVPDAPPTTVGRGWRLALLVNLPLPILLAAIIPLGWFIDQSGWIDAYYARILVLIGYNIILAVSLQLINGFSGQFSLGHAGFMAVGAYLAAYPAINVANQYKDPFAALLFFISLAIVTAIAGGALYGLFTAARATKRLHPSAPAAVILLLIVWLLVDLAAAAKHEITPAHLLWTRSFSSLQSLLSSIQSHGLPAATKLSALVPAVVQKPLCFVILLIGAGCCAGATGFIVGLPALRLKGDYLAIATLGMGEIIRIIIINTPAFGSALGLTSIPRYANFAWLYGIAIITVFVIWRIAYSAAGRAIMAVREDEIAAAAIGLRNTYHKVLAFVIGAFFAGVAGAVFALNEYSITPNRFTMERSIEVVVMVTLGGLGSISGAILAAVVLTLLPEWLRGSSISWLSWIAEYRMILYSLALIVMMLMRPRGLLGGRELWPRRRGPRAPAPTTDEHKEALAA